MYSILETELCNYAAHARPVLLPSTSTTPNSKKPATRLSKLPTGAVVLSDDTLYLPHWDGNTLKSLSKAIPGVDATEWSTPNHAESEVVKVRRWIQDDVCCLMLDYVEGWALPLPNTTEHLSFSTKHTPLYTHTHMHTQTLTCRWWRLTAATTLLLAMRAATCARQQQQQAIKHPPRHRQQTAAASLLRTMQMAITMTAPPATCPACCTAMQSAFSRGHLQVCLSCLCELCCTVLTNLFLDLMSADAPPTLPHFITFHLLSPQLHTTPPPTHNTPTNATTASCAANAPLGPVGTLSTTATTHPPAPLKGAAVAIGYIQGCGGDYFATHELSAAVEDVSKVEREGRPC